MADSGRYYVNKFPDYNICHEKHRYVIKEGLAPEFSKEIRKCASKFLTKLENNLSSYNTSDVSVYTGKAGIALLYFRLSETQSSGNYLQKALSLIEECLAAKISPDRISFLTGAPGPLAIGAVIFHKIGKVDRSRNCIEKIKSFAPVVLDLKSDIPDEMLYGRSGYLLALQFVNRHIGENAFGEDFLKSVVSAIVTSGCNLARKEKSELNLLYKWHDKYYIGAVHGFAGILHLLLQYNDLIDTGDLKVKVFPVVKYILSLQFKTGNYPSSLGNSSDRLMQWCHGASGMVNLALTAAEVFRNNDFLVIAESMGDAVWDYGLLTKGYGLCHGVSGNAYALLSLYQATNNPKYLYRATRFAEWAMTFNKFQKRIPDRPLSLFEGLAGIIYFLFEVLQPQTSRFPAL